VETAVVLDNITPTAWTAVLRAAPALRLERHRLFPTVALSFKNIEELNILVEKYYENIVSN